MNEPLIDVADVISHAFAHIDSRLMNHGKRVAYILMKIFEDKNEFSLQEKQDIFMLGLLHDIGAYKEEEIDSILSFDLQDSMEHAIWGYLLFQTFSPLPEYADIILYHHHCNAQYYSVPISDYHRRLARLLYLADRIDIFCEQNGSGQLGSFLNSYCGSIFTEQDIQWFQAADQKFEIIEHLLSGAYHEEINTYTSQQLHFSDVQMHDFLLLFIFSIDFRNEYTAMHTGYAVLFSQKIANMLHLTSAACNTIELAALLHNIGKISLPVSIESMEDYDWYLKKMYKPSTQDITRDILTDSISPKIVRVIEQSYQLLDCLSNNNKTEFCFLPEAEIVALSYLLSNALTLDEDIGVRHHEHLLDFLKDRYRTCGINNHLLLTLEKEYDAMVQECQISCDSLSSTYKQMMEEYHSLNMILLHYNRKYH